jgi:hypothetical protein
VQSTDCTAGGPGLACYLAPTVSDPDERPGRAPGPGDPDDEDEEYAPTPFDNPFFLPVILLAFAVWFIYDGWFNPDMEWIKFNRVGAAVTSVLGVYYAARAIKERRAREQQGAAPEGGSGA